MSKEILPTIYQGHTVLANLLTVDGEKCGTQILHDVLQSDLIIVIGEPAVGKSTISGQIINELQRRDIPTQEVKYDNELANHIQSTGIHKEREGFNAQLVSTVQRALDTISSRGKVIFDTVGVGAKRPKDRSVSAVENLIEEELAKGKYKILLLAVLGSLSNQLKQVALRRSVLNIPPDQVIQVLEEEYNTIVAHIPASLSDYHMGQFIQKAVKKMAEHFHITQISNEVLQQSMEIVRKEGMQILDKFLPPPLPPGDQIMLRIKTAGMQRRLQSIPLPDTAKHIVYNIHSNERVLWYAETFLVDEE